MKQFSLRLTVAAFSALLFCGMETGPSAGAALQEQSVKPLSCSALEYRQFDFWLGDWDAFENNSSTPVARARVQSLLGGCVLREDYQDTGGMKGQRLPPSLAPELGNQSRKAAGDRGKDGRR